MDNILHGLQNEVSGVSRHHFCSSSLQKHIGRLKIIFDRKEVVYLGHTIIKNGVLSNTDIKSQLFKNFLYSKHQKTLRSFLELVGYYRHFVPNLDKIAKSFTHLLQENVVLNFSGNCLQAFKKSKLKLITKLKKLSIIIVFLSLYRMLVDISTGAKLDTYF